MAPVYTPDSLAHHDDSENLLGIGDQVAGKYTIRRVLGQGGMGVVYEALHVRLDRKVALKMLHRNMLESPSVVERFEREALAASKLKGPNVADVIDVDVTDDGVPFIVMEYLEGRDLAQELDARLMLPTSEAVAIVLQACSAMAVAHQAGIVHRDLKPANLFLHRQGKGHVLKVLDFGISKMAQSESTNVTLTQSTLGTPMYMSPEQIRSTKHVDGRTDIWSLGVILFECLAGGTPFSGDNPTAVVAAISVDQPASLDELCPDSPAGLNDVVRRALAKDPAARYQTVEEFAEALLPYSSDPAAWIRPAASSRGYAAARPAVLSLRPEEVSGEAPTVRPPSAVTAGAWTADGTKSRTNRTPLFLAIGGALAAGIIGFLLRGGEQSAPAASAGTASLAGASAVPPAQSPVVQPLPTPVVTPPTQPAAAPSNGAAPNNVAAPSASAATSPSPSPSPLSPTQAAPAAKKRESGPRAPHAAPAAEPKPTNPVLL
ncbi:MAG TPA: protein kinase [Polyangiaceae bacterium]|nr:protein kinase [Polyangiaceae bacterium]